MLEKNKKKNYIRWTIMGCALICFGLIASQVMQNPEISFDENLRYWVYEQRSPFFNAIFIPVTYMGNWQNITILAVGTAMGKDGATEYTSVTLEVTVQDALNINAVAWWGNIRLLLRSPLDNEIIEIETVNQQTVYDEKGGA